MVHVDKAHVGGVLVLFFLTSISWTALGADGGHEEVSAAQADNTSDSGSGGDATPQASDTDSEQGKTLPQGTGVQGKSDLPPEIKKALVPVAQSLKDILKGKSAEDTQQVLNAFKPTAQTKDSKPDTAATILGRIPDKLITKDQRTNLQKTVKKVFALNTPESAKLLQAAAGELAIKGKTTPPAQKPPGDPAVKTVDDGKNKGTDGGATDKKVADGGNKGAGAKTDDEASVLQKRLDDLSKKIDDQKRQDQNGLLNTLLRGENGNQIPPGLLNRLGQNGLGAGGLGGGGNGGGNGDGGGGRGGQGSDGLNNLVDKLDRHNDNNNNNGGNFNPYGMGMGMGGVGKDKEDSDSSKAKKDDSSDDTAFNPDLKDPNADSSDDSTDKPKTPDPSLSGDPGAGLGDLGGGSDTKGSSKPSYPKLSLASPLRSGGGGGKAGGAGGGGASRKGGGGGAPVRGAAGGGGGGGGDNGVFQGLGVTGPGYMPRMPYNFDRPVEYGSASGGDAGTEAGDGGGEGDSGGSFRFRPGQMGGVIRMTEGGNEDGPGIFGRTPHNFCSGALSKDIGICERFQLHRIAQAAMSEDSE